jgi:hypothetical protein
MEAPDLWVINDDGTEIIRARDIVAVSLDYNGNVTARLAGQDATVVTLVAQRAHLDEDKPGDLHRQLIRIVAHLTVSENTNLPGWAVGRGGST